MMNISYLGIKNLKDKINEINENLAHLVEIEDYENASVQAGLMEEYVLKLNDFVAKYKDDIGVKKGLKEFYNRESDVAVEVVVEDTAENTAEEDMIEMVISIVKNKRNMDSERLNSIVCELLEKESVNKNKPFILISQYKVLNTNRWRFLGVVSSLEKIDFNEYQIKETQKAVYLQNSKNNVRYILKQKKS